MSAKRRQSEFIVLLCRWLSIIFFTITRTKTQQASSTLVQW